MPHPRRAFGVLLVLVLLAPALSGCAGSEPSAAPVAAARGLVDGVVSELKREDDEAELKEIREAKPPTNEERKEAHEQAEWAAVESHQAEAEESEG
jgi:hypothetical protein